MTHFKCKENDNKKKIIAEYDIKPVSHLLLLKGQERAGCCGKLTREYFIFHTIHKQTKKEGSFMVGESCAKDFLKLSGQNSIPLSNLFQSTSTTNSGNVVSGNSTISNSKLAHPLNRLLIEAINFLCASLDKTPQNSILKILDFTNDNQTNPNLKGIEFFNNIIYSDLRGVKLTDAFNAIKEENNFKNIDFSPLHEHILSLNVPSYYM